MLWLVFISVFVFSIENEVDGCGEYKDCVSCSTTAMIKDNQIRCSWVNDTCKELSEEEYKENNQPKKWYKFFQQCDSQNSYFQTDFNLSTSYNKSGYQYIINFVQKNNGTYVQKNAAMKLYLYFDDPLYTLEATFNYSVFNLKEDDKFLLIIKDEFDAITCIQDKEEFFQEQASRDNNVFKFHSFYIYYFNSEEKYHLPFQINISFTSFASLYSFDFATFLGLLIFFSFLLGFIVLYGIFFFYKNCNKGFKESCKLKELCMCFYFFCNKFWDKHCYSCCNHFLCSCCYCKKNSKDKIKNCKEIEVEDLNPPKSFKKSKNKNGETEPDCPINPSV